MDKIKKITDVILSEAKEEADRILAKVDVDIEIEKSKYEAEIQSIQHETSIQVNSDKEAIDRRSQSMLESKLRELDLKKKQMVIEKVLTKALNQFAEMSVDQKVSLYEKMILSRDIDAGQISLNQNDQACLDKLISKLGPSFTKGPVAEIQGGVLVSKGKIEENLSLDLVLRDKRAALASYISSQLF